MDSKKVGGVICFDCGHKYGKYSVGCSSVWTDTCDYCGERKGVTETRDFGYPFLPAKHPDATEAQPCN